MSRPSSVMQSKMVPDGSQQPGFPPILQAMSDRPSSHDDQGLSHDNVHDVHNAQSHRRQTWLMTLQESVLASWTRNKGLAMVIIAQFFGTIMNVITRLLERGSEDRPGMHPFQILFVRMLGTMILSLTYQWWAKVKDAPLGPKEVRLLLVARGFGGFFGVYGLYYSLRYLNLSDATVITFLAPTVACFACSILIKEPFTRSEQVAALVSFLGVVLIARPASLFSRSAGGPASSGGSDVMIMPGNATAPAGGIEHPAVTSSQRLSAVGWALIGVLGAASAYTTIRWIGQRAHALITVNYYATWTTLVSFVALLFVPRIHFRLPAGIVQWIYMLILGTCGFTMQYLLTQGLAYEKSSRATNMVYTQMLFALAFDKLVWNETPSITSVFGSSLILASALYVALLNSSKAKEVKNALNQDPDEELGMLNNADRHDNDENQDTR